MSFTKSPYFPGFQMAHLLAIMIKTYSAIHVSWVPRWLFVDVASAVHGGCESFEVFIG